MLPKEGKVTRRSIMEYAEVVRGRYMGVSKKPYQILLKYYCDEFSIFHITVYSTSHGRAAH